MITADWKISFKTAALHCQFPYASEQSLPTLEITVSCHGFPGSRHVPGTQTPESRQCKNTWLCAGEQGSGQGCADPGRAHSHGLPGRIAPLGAPPVPAWTGRWAAGAAAPPAPWAAAARRLWAAASGRTCPRHRTPSGGAGRSPWPPA